MSLNGTLQTMSLADLLQYLEVSKQSGQMKVANGQIQKEVFFKDGSIVCALSNNPRELFGQFLLQRGKLAEGQLQRAMTKHRQTGERLGRILVAEGLLSEAEVMELLTARYVESIYELFLWTEAHFEFIPEVPPPGDMILLEIKPSAVVMEGIYRLDEWSRFRQVIPSDRVFFQLTLQASFANVTLSEEAPRLLFFIGKKMSVGEIIMHMHASPFQVYAGLYELAQLGLIRVEGEHPPELEEIPTSAAPLTFPQLLENISRLLEAGKAEEALVALQPVLSEAPNHEQALQLRSKAELLFSRGFFRSGLTPQTVLFLAVGPEALMQLNLTQQEGFILSRINDSWDINAILSVSPFREAESLRIIQHLLEKGLIRV